MSKLRKAMERAGRRESGQLGFANKAREKRRAMLLGALVRDAKGAKEALDAGVDVVVLHNGDARDTAKALKDLGETSKPAGAWLTELDESGAQSLADAGCDFVACTIEGTTAAAVDTSRMGQVVTVTGELEDATLRALAPLGLDGIFVKRPAGGITLAQQTALIRLAQLSNSPLLVSLGTDESVATLRVLRDSGTAVVLAPEGSTKTQIEQLAAMLRDVPAPKRGEERGREIALVPSIAGHNHEHDDGPDEDE